MLTKYPTLLLAGLLSAAFSVPAAEIQAQSYRHIDYLAMQMERQAEQLHHEVHAHFRLTPDYQHLDQAVAKMEQLAHHIHEVVHQDPDIQHLREDVEQIDQLYHHVQGIIGKLGHTRQVDPQALWHFRVAMARLGNNLHHLRDDLASLQGPHQHNYYAPPQNGVPLQAYPLQNGVPLQQNPLQNSMPYQQYPNQIPNNGFRNPNFYPQTPGTGVQIQFSIPLRQLLRRP